MEHGHHADSRNIAYFRHVYDGEHADLRHLYEQAKLDQWNAAPISTGRSRATAPDLEALGVSLAAA